MTRHTTPHTHTHTHTHTPHTHTHTNTEAPFTRKTVTSATNIPIPFLSLLYLSLTLISSYLITSLYFSFPLFFSLFFLLSSFFNIYPSLIHLTLICEWFSSTHFTFIHLYLPFIILPLFSDEYNYVFLNSIHTAAGCSWIIRMSYKEKRSGCVEGYTCTHTHTSTHPSQIVLSSNLSIIISCHLLSQQSDPSHKLYNRERWRKNSLCRQVSEWNRGWNGPWTKYLVRKTTLFNDLITLVSSTLQ